MAVALARAGHVEQALQVLIEAKDWPHAPDTPRRVALAFARAGLAEPALTALATISPRRPRAEALGTVAVALAATGNLKDALRAVTSNDDTRQRDHDLLDLLPSALRNPSNHESRQILEQILFMPNAAKHLPAFPIALQERLVRHKTKDPPSLS